MDNGNNILYQHPGNQPDEYVKCPYFPEHELRKSRLPYHLQKCQQNPKAPKLLACPYNFMHRIRPEDREDHMVLCEDRINFKYSDRKPASYGNTLKDHFKIDNRDLIKNQQKKSDELQKDFISQQVNGNDEEYWD